MIPQVTNTEQLATTKARADVLKIAEAGLAAIATQSVIQNTVSVSELGITIADNYIPHTSYERLYVVGVGKCALDAAYSLEEILGSYITDGVVVDVRCDSGILKHIRSCGGTHPYPSEENVDFTRELLALLNQTTKDDLVLVVISGGASTLLCQPKTHTCQDEEQLVQQLFARGASIHDLNVLRKHLSLARGGHMAALAAPAQVQALIFSDVPGNDIATIASGPTVLDTTTVEDAKTVLDRYTKEGEELFDASHFFETPKDPELFSSTHNHLVLTNTTALTAMQEKAKELGYQAEIVTDLLEGEVERVAEDITDRLHGAPPSCVQLYGGETTVRFSETTTGVGGRNHHLALCALAYVQKGEVLLPFASDGRDNSESAGGLADSITKEHAQSKNISPEDYIVRGDSVSFFLGIEDAVITGYTGSNVADLIIALKA